MENPENMLKKSVDLCRQLLAKTEEVRDGVQSATPARLGELTSALRLLQEQIVSTDQDLAPCLENDPRLRQSPGNLERIALMRKIARLTDELLPILKGVQAIQREELRKIASGRQMMSGYHSHTDNSGRLLNTSK